MKTNETDDLGVTSVRFAFCSKGMPAQAAKEYAEFAQHELAKLFSIPGYEAKVLHDKRLPLGEPFTLTTYAKKPCTQVAFIYAAKKVLPRLLELQKRAQHASPLSFWNPGVDLAQDHQALTALAGPQPVDCSADQAAWLSSIAALTSSEPQSIARQAAEALALIFGGALSTQLNAANYATPL